MSLLTVGASDICSAGPVTSGAIGLAGPVAMSKRCQGDAQGTDRCPSPFVVLLSCLELGWGRSAELVSELCWLLMSLGAVVQTEGVAHA